MSTFQHINIKETEQFLNLALPVVCSFIFGVAVFALAPAMMLLA